MLAVPCVLVLANVFGGISLGAQSSGEEAPCIKQRHLPAFTAYNLGSRFDGLSLAARLEMYTGQTTVVIFSYGTPDPPRLARRAAHALARVIAPKLSGISATRLRALAVDPHGCGRPMSK
jgi:hypothetical protein